jgi:hypothetical protein
MPALKTLRPGSPRVRASTGRSSAVGLPRRTLYFQMKLGAHRLQF